MVGKRKRKRMKTESCWRDTQELVRSIETKSPKSAMSGALQQFLFLKPSYMIVTPGEDR